MFPRRLRVVLAVLAVVGITIVILSLRGGSGPFGLVRSAAGSVVGALQEVASAAVSPIFATGDWLSTWGDQRSRIAELEAENEQLRGLVERSAADRARADDLDALLRVAGIGQYTIVPAEVIAVGPQQEFGWTVTIDAGRIDGVQQDMTVINGEGLVGRVASVNRMTSTVVLLVDASTAVGARVAGSDEIGILSGTGGQDSLEFQLLDPLADLQPGEALVTFGSRSGRPYAPGIPIGEVVSVSGTGGQLTRIATVRPFADMSSLNVLGVVVKPPREDPRDAVLPTRPAQPTQPTPSPAATDAVPGTEASNAPAGEASPAQEQAATPEAG